MTRIATLFMATGAVLALIGMVWGIQMAIIGDHTLAPAHGHLNLIGFVAMSIFGIFYALSPSAAASRLSIMHYALTMVAIVVLVPGIVMVHTGGSETLAKIGSILAVLSMALFAFIVLRHGVGAGASDAGVEERVAAPAE